MKVRAGMTDPFVGAVQRFDALAAEIPEEYLDLLVRALGLSPGGTLLELGCGTGGLARRFASRGVHVDAIDQSRAMIERARERSDPAVRLFNESVSSFHFEESRYHAIVSFEAFHLFPDRSDLVRRLAHAARAKGRLGIGWRLAGWEDNQSDLIRSQFERYGVDFTDWGHWLCADIHLSLDEDWTPPEIFTLQVPTHTSVVEAVDFICSIHRFSLVPTEARRPFRSELEASLRDANRGQQGFTGMTTYGVTVTQYRPS